MTAARLSRPVVGVGCGCAASGEDPLSVSDGLLLKKRARRSGEASHSRINVTVIGGRLGSEDHRVLNLAGLRGHILGPEYYHPTC